MITPVLFLVFNRPDTTEQVFEAIREARPLRLYVAADGPRADHAGEAERCAEVRRIATAVDWPCEVKVLFRDQNLGCRAAVSGAIDWLFAHEESGIILEDDCVPDHSFFRYCSDLLEYYRSDERIMCISGDNFHSTNVASGFSYHYSRNMHCWGWATWRRAWRLYDANLSLWPEVRDGRKLRLLGGPAFEQYWTSTFNETAARKIDSWAYVFLFSCWSQSGLTIIPEVNLVRNIGFGPNATHTHDGDTVPSAEISFPLRHPKTVMRDADSDIAEDINQFGIRESVNPSLWTRVLRIPMKSSIRIYSMLRKLFASSSTHANKRAG